MAYLDEYNQKSLLMRHEFLHTVVRLAIAVYVEPAEGAKPTRLTSSVVEAIEWVAAPALSQSASSRPEWGRSAACRW